MSKNTGNTVVPGCNRKLYLIVTCIALILLGVIVIVVFQTWSADRASREEAIQATLEAERQLTKLYGEEVKRVVENFHSRWASLEAMRDPNVRSELAVTPFLNDYLPSTPDSTAICDTPPCLIVKSVGVKSVRVLEYGPEHFKAIACATAELNRVASDGGDVNSLPPYDFRYIYVFVRVEDSWKLAGLFNITISQDARRDWDYAPEWLRQVIGALPDDIHNCEPMR